MSENINAIFAAVVFHALSLAFCSDIPLSFSVAYVSAPSASHSAKREVKPANPAVVRYVPIVPSHSAPAVAVPALAPAIHAGARATIKGTLVGTFCVQNRESRILLSFASIS